MNDSFKSEPKAKEKQDLVERTKSFISNALSELSNIVEKTSWRDISYSQRGTDILQQISTRPDFPNIIPDAEFTGRLSALRKFTQFLNGDNAFLSMKQLVVNETQIEWYWLIPHLVSRDILTEYLWLVNSLDYNDEIATRVAVNFADFIINPVSEITFYSVLRGINSSFDQVDFLDNVKIKKLSLDEVSSLAIRNDSLRSNDKVPENRTVLEESFTFSYGRMPGDIFSRLSNKFDLIVEALRIVKPGRVDRENIYWRWDKPGQLGNRELVSSGSARPKPPITNSYALEANDLSSLEQIYRSLDKQPELHRIARQRFNEATQRANPEDTIIDLCIALEALLSEGSGSVTYKLGMRAAILVGNNTEEKRNIVALISDAYSMRSAFVHGGSSGTSQKLKLSLVDLAKKLLETCRQILKAVIEYQTNNGKAIDTKDMDDILLS